MDVKNLGHFNIYNSFDVAPMNARYHSLGGLCIVCARSRSSDTVYRPYILMNKKLDVVIVVYIYKSCDVYCTVLQPRRTTLEMSSGYGFGKLNINLET